MSAHPRAACPASVSEPYLKYMRRDLIQGARPWRGAVAGEVAVERSVRGDLEAGRGAQGSQMFVVIGGGVQGAGLTSEMLTYLAKADIAISRLVQRVGDHDVDSRHRGAFLVGLLQYGALRS
jgi:hypothetical protein